MSRFILVSLGLAAVSLAAPAQDKAKPDPDKPLKSRVTISKETTFVLGPVDKDGYIDYVAALNERLGQGVTPANNAVVLIWQALGPRPEGQRMPAEFYKWLGSSEPPEQGEYFIGMREYLKDHLKVDEYSEQGKQFYDQQSRASQRAWTANDLPNIAAWLKANEKPLAVVVEATKRPRYYQPIVPDKTGKGPTSLLTALLPSAQKCRELTAALSARAMLRVGEGRLDDAWQDLLACHRLARHVSHGGTLIEGLVGVALEQVAGNADLVLLQRPELTSKQIMQRLGELQRLPAMPSMADKVALGERILFLDSIRYVDERGLTGLEALAGFKPESKPNPIALRYVQSINWNEGLRHANNWYDRLSGAMRVKTYAERQQAMVQVEEEIKELKAESARTSGMIRLTIGTPESKGKALCDIMLCLLTPAVMKVQSAGDRIDQVQQNLHIAYALAAHQREHGSYPAKLDALAPKFLAKVPLDMFTGKPLIYRPADKGYLLYSVGVNGRDDEGRFTEDEPPGDDLAVRMPLPPLRK